MYTIKMTKKMADILDPLAQKVTQGAANADEKRLYDKLSWTFHLLSENPRHPGLNSKKVQELKKRYRLDVWESYIENQTSAAKRLYWMYGPNKQEITLISVELHPNNGLPYKQIAREAKRIKP